MILNIFQRPRKDYYAQWGQVCPHVACFMATRIDYWSRNAFLVKEKQLTRLRDKLNAERRPLPMVRIEKTYCFQGA